MGNGYAKYSGLGGGSNSGGVTSLNTLTGALTLIAGSNVTITPGSGTLTIASSGGGGGVSSVGLVDSTGLFTVTGSPVTTSGNLTLSAFASQTAKTFLAGPNASSGAASFRLILATDIPTLNQNTTGTAANITATSNSSLTTLSSLSLPGTQVTGNITGNAANITATSNSTLTTLSSLSLPGAQVTGNISGNAANITATSNSTLTTLSSLSLPLSQTTGVLPIANGGTNNGTLPVTAGGVVATDGSKLTNVGAGTSGYFLQSNGASAPTWVNTTPTSVSYAQSYFTSIGTPSWQVTSATMADFALASGTATLVSRKSNGITLTAAAGNLPGITFTPDSVSSTYLIICSYTVYDTLANDPYNTQLTDGTTVISASAGYYALTTGANVYPVTNSGIYVPGTTSPVTVKLQGVSPASGTGTVVIGQNIVTPTVIEWTVVKQNTIGSGGGITEAQVYARVAYGM